MKELSMNDEEEYRRSMNNKVSSEKNMTSSERRHVYYYHFTKWPTDIYPLGSNLMDFVSDIQTCYRRFPPLPGDCDVTVRPVLIHDRDGSSRAALLSLVLHLTEQVEDWGEFVDVYSAVQIVLGRRKGVITDVNDYNYLYKVLWSILHFVHKTKEE